jgi:hypothetical protein
MSLKEDLVDFCYKYTFEKDDSKRAFSLKLFVVSVYRTMRSWAPVYKTRMLLQRTFRRDHLSDNMIWETGFYTSKELLKRLRAYKKHKRMGYPSTFSEYDEMTYKSRAEYDKYVASGDIVGGGPEKWEETLDQMIQAFEYVAEIADDVDTPKTRAWYEKYYGFSPYDESDIRNQSKSFYTREKKEDGSIAVKTSKTPFDDCLIREININYDLLKYIEDDIQAKLHLFAEYLRALWD